MKNFLVVFGMGIVLIPLLSFTMMDQPKPWSVPDKYEKMKNPVKSDASSIAEGKALYGQHCQSCHGKKGLGDGPKAANLETECGNFTKPDFQKQSDGALLFKISEGRHDMPSFKKKISDQEDIWKLVVYVRTLGKK
jgi:mono/diheme cytochrome c family protein